MNKFIGYIGAEGCNEFLSLYSQKHKTDNMQIGTIKDNNTHLLPFSEIEGESEISLAIINNFDSPRYSDSFITCAANGQTNIENINLPFSIFSRPKTIDDIFIYMLEYINVNSRNDTFKSLTPSLTGDLSYMYYDKNSNAIYLSMGAMPIVIGIGDGFNIIANEIDEISPYLSKFIALSKGEKAKITSDRITIYNNKFHKIKKPICKINSYTQNDNDFSLDEQLFTLSSSVSKLLNNTIKDEKLYYPKLKLNKMNAKAYSKIVIVADKDSYYSALCSKKIFTVLCAMPIEIHLASEYIRENKALDCSTLFIGVGMSGEDTELNSCISYAKSCKAKVIGISANKYSYLSRQCDYLIETPSIICSEDNTSLNSFVMTYLSLSFFSIFFGNLIGTVSEVYMDVAIKMASMLPGKVAQAARQSDSFCNLSDLLKGSGNIIFTGCGIDYALAHHISNIYSKLNSQISAAKSTFMLNCESINSRSTIVAIISCKDYLFEFKEELKSASTRGANIIVVSNCNIGDSLEEFKNIIAVPDSLPIFNIILCSSFLYSLSIYTQKYDPNTLENDII